MNQTVEQQIEAILWTAPRVTEEDMQNNIKHIEIVHHVSRAGQVLRWAIITTQNGFAVTGDPAVAVSSENDNEQIGTNIAIQNAKHSLWGLMGYALREKLHGQMASAIREEERYG